jgi:hypothetical protein
MNGAKLDWKKSEKAFYLPGTEPGLVAVPAFKFFSLRGQGNPKGWVENKSRKVYERFWPEDWKRADRVRVCGVNRRLVLQVLPVEPGTIVLMDRLNP